MAENHACKRPATDKEYNLLGSRHKSFQLRRVRIVFSANQDNCFEESSGSRPNHQSIRQMIVVAIWNSPIGE